MYKIFFLHINMQSFYKIIMLTHCISFALASHLLPIVLMYLFSSNITFVRVCINSYTMFISCMPIIAISVNAMNCWVDCNLILDKLWFWWIWKTLSKRWHLEKLMAIGGWKNSMVHLFLNFGSKWMSWLLICLRLHLCICMNLMTRL